MRHFPPPRKITPPRDYFASLRASHRPLTDVEKVILRAEMMRRYAWRDEQQRRANPLRLLTLVRLNELERIWLDNYGLYLPDDDSGWDDLDVMAHHLAHLGGSADKIAARIVEWAAMWTEFPTDKVTRLARQIATNPPRKWKADTLAWRLQLTMAQRTRLKITTIGAIDVKPADRPAWLRGHHRQRKETERRANGVKPRAEYLAGSISAEKPWVAQGMSRATWYRKGKPKRPGETSVADHKDRTRYAGPVSPDLSHGACSKLPRTSGKKEPASRVRHRQSTPHPAQRPTDQMTSGVDGRRSDGGGIPNGVAVRPDHDQGITSAQVRTP